MLDFSRNGNVLIGLLLEASPKTECPKRGQLPIAAGSNWLVLYATTHALRVALLFGLALQQLRWVMG